MKVIIIPGSKIPFRDFRKNEWPCEFKNYLIKKGIRAEVFEWNGGIFLWQIKNASKNLDKFLAREKGKVILFCKSNGGLIAQFSSLNHKDKIKKIVQIATPNLSKKYNGKIPIISIYSKKDKVQPAGIIIHLITTLKPGSRILDGKNAKNILINKKNHTDFNKKEMFGFYSKFLK